MELGGFIGGKGAGREGIQCLLKIEIESQINSESVSVSCTGPSGVT